jgi:hypothetical protein
MQWCATVNHKCQEQWVMFSLCLFSKFVTCLLMEALQEFNLDSQAKWIFL